MNENTHIVRSGDTVNKIAKLHNCEPSAIVGINHLSKSNLIRVGQKLKLPDTLLASNHHQKTVDEKSEKPTLWMQFVDVLNAPIQGLKVMLSYGDDQSEHTTDAQGYVPPVLPKDKKQEVNVKVEKAAGGWKELKPVRIAADATYVRLRSPKILLKSVSAPHEGEAPKKEKPKKQEPGSVTETRSPGGNPVQVVNLECPNNDNLRLGPNFKYRDFVLSASQRSGLIPQAIAAIMNVEAAKLRVQHETSVINKKTMLPVLDKKGNPKVKKWWESTGEWDAKSASPLSSARGMTQFLDGSWIDQALIEGTFLNTKVKANGWLTTTNIEVKKGKAVLEKTVPAFKLSNGQLASSSTGSTLARTLSSRPYLTGRATASDANLQALLDLRFEAEYAIQTAVDYGMQNLNALAAGGYKISNLTDGEKAKTVYLCHHLGLADAKAFINNTMNADHAGYLLINQKGGASANVLIANEGGDKLKAHREWLRNFVDTGITLPERMCDASAAPTVRSLIPITEAIRSDN